MKILLGLGKYSGSNIFGSRLLTYAYNNEFRIAAHFKNHSYLKMIDWVLDPVLRVWLGKPNYFVQHGSHGPFVDYEYADFIINELVEWSPDLVISDCEPLTATIAGLFNIPLWYVSPMLYLTGTVFNKYEINSFIFNKELTRLHSLPKANRYFIYSPVCDLLDAPQLKEGYEWIRPFTAKPEGLLSSERDDKIISILEQSKPPNSLITTGETSFVADAFYSINRFYISPNINCLEKMLNAQIMNHFKIAKNIGRPKNVRFALKKVEQPSFKRTITYSNSKFLHEVIDGHQKSDI
jgi:hypothetical protein